MLDLTRDVLIGEASDAIDALPTRGPAQEVERFVAITAAVDTVLRLVSDDLDDFAIYVGSDGSHASANAILHAANRVRSLLLPTKGGQP